VDTQRAVGGGYKSAIGATQCGGYTGLRWLYSGGCGGHIERLWWLHREPVLDAQRDCSGYTEGRRDSHGYMGG
jgi:hypothetical protein